jgi:hypothetical protein
MRSSNIFVTSAVAGLAPARHGVEREKLRVKSERIIILILRLKKLKIPERFDRANFPLSPMYYNQDRSYLVDQRKYRSNEILIKKLKSTGKCGT